MTLVTVELLSTRDQGNKFIRNHTEQARLAGGSGIILTGHIN